MPPAGLHILAYHGCQEIDGTVEQGSMGIHRTSETSCVPSTVKMLTSPFSDMLQLESMVVEGCQDIYETLPGCLWLEKLRLLWSTSTCAKLHPGDQLDTPGAPGAA